MLENEFGSLSRVVGLFSQRGYNIDTLTVAPTDDETLSRITLTTEGDDKMVEQIVKQLYKLIDTLKVTDLTDGSHIERELMLVKIKSKERRRAKREGREAPSLVFVFSFAPVKNGGGAKRPPLLMMPSSLFWL